MKALRSSLANQLLADPVARNQLRNFAGSAVGVGKLQSVPTVELKTTNGKTVLYLPVVVAKAA